MRAVPCWLRYCSRSLLGCLRLIVLPLYPPGHPPLISPGAHHCASQQRCIPKQSALEPICGGGCHGAVHG